MAWKKLGMLVFAMVVSFSRHSETRKFESNTTHNQDQYYLSATADLPEHFVMRYAVTGTKAVSIHAFSRDILLLSYSINIDVRKDGLSTIKIRKNPF